jgi:hypothetical protein
VEGEAPLFAVGEAPLLAIMLLVLAACAAALVAGCGSVPGLGGEVTGSGTPMTKQYQYSGFSRLRVDNAFVATVTRGDTFAVSVTVDDNLGKYLRVEVDGDTLRIGLDPTASYNNVIVKAAVTMPGLRAMEVNGGASANVQGFASQDSLDVLLSGAGKANFTGVSAGKVSIEVSGGARLSGGLQAQELNGEVSGAGQVSFNGSASRAKLEASGAGKLDLKDFIVQEADLQLSGGASGTVTVTGTLNVSASGGAHLDYYGSPSIGKTDVSGGAQVNHAGG